MDKNELQKFLSAVTAVVQEGQLTVTDGIAVVAHTDQSNVSMVETKIPLTGDNGVYGVDFKKLLTAVNTCKGKDVELELGSPIKLKCGRIKHQHSSLALSTLQPIRKVPNVPFACILGVDTNEFFEIFDAIGKISDSEKNEHISIDFIFDGKNLNVKTTNDPVDFIEQTFTITDIELGKGEKFTSRYSFDFIREFVSAIKKFKVENIQISFGNDLPLRIVIKDTVEVCFLLAQRIERE